LGGAQGASPARAPVALPRIPLQAYPAALQAQVAREIDGAVAGEAWPLFVTDYGRLRRAVCAAEGWRQPTCRRMQGGGDGS
jgi:hypothetical protein